ncbi:RidA family protein [Mycobacterium sp. NPDC003449]
MTTTPIRPQGHYVAAVVHNDTVISAGMTPRDDDTLLAVGPVSADGATGTVAVAAAAELAGHATARAIRACEDVLAEGAVLVRPISLTVFVRCDSEFSAHSAVADGASNLLAQRFGAVPVRAAVGVVSLPGGAPVEVQLTMSWT